MNESIRGRLIAFTVTAGVVYFCLYWLFNKFAWAWIDKWLDIPVLAGNWVIVGNSLDMNGDVIHAWQGELVISQYWDRISIELKTPKSSSWSESASLLVKANGESKLSYSYQNHPRVGESELQKHQGFCELIFDAAQKSAEGHYFNSMGRYTIGSMSLVRKGKVTA